MRLILLLLLPAVIVKADDEYWRHPANARAAASCAHAFLDAGNLQQARFFATLAQEEDLRDPDALLAFARLEMKSGHPMVTDLERMAARHPKKRKETARVLLAGARDLLTAGGSAPRFFDARLALHAAMELDPSLRPEARALTFAVVRNELTPRTAFDVAALLLAVADRKNDPEVGRLIVEIANRAIALKQPRIAGLYLTSANQLQSPERPRIARLLVATARMLMKEDRNAAHYSITTALHVDPALRQDEKTMSLVRRLLPRPAGRPSAPLVARCGVGDSPFGRNVIASDVRFFESVPLPPIAPSPRRRQFLAQCRTLAPPLFPEPFDSRRIGRTAEEEIFDRDRDAQIHRRAGRCIAESSYEIAIDPSGSVTHVTILSARFDGDTSSSSEALQEEEAHLIPILMKRRFKPARIGEVPIRATWRGGVRRECGF